MTSITETAFATLDQQGRLLNAVLKGPTERPALLGFSRGDSAQIRATIRGRKQSAGIVDRPGIAVANAGEPTIAFFASYLLSFEYLNALTGNCLKRNKIAEFAAVITVRRSAGPLAIVGLRVRPRADGDKRLRIGGSGHCKARPNRRVNLGQQSKEKNWEEPCGPPPDHYAPPIINKCLRRVGMDINSEGQFLKRSPTISAHRDIPASVPAVLADQVRGLDIFNVCNGFSRAKDRASCAEQPLAALQPTPSIRKMAAIRP